MNKLTYLETLAAEEQEAQKAKEAYRKQRRQYFKRVFFVPLVGKYIFLFVVLLFSHLLALYVGLVLSDIKTIEKVVEKVIYKCNLPDTGASI